MANEPGHDRGPGPRQLASNGPVSALPPPDPLPATAADMAAGGIRFPAEVMNGDESLISKRKRGRPPKIGGKAKAVAAPAAKRSKKEEEDVCFICFDGGNLVLCDRRDCPKAYHPACVKRDESFFKRRVRWNCGWHLCNICQRTAIFMCYTCPYSLCKTCVKQADISCVRGSKGFCKTCMNTISLIENIKQGNEEVGHVDFDDTTSWEYLFKVYWVYLKEKESLTLDELTRATNPWKGLVLNHVNNSSQESQNNCVNRTVELSNTADPLGIQNNQVDTTVSKRRKTRKQPPLQNNSRERIIADELLEGVGEWGSQELLEFVAHVKNGDTSKLTHFDVQALLLEYIRKNKLRDPRRKCQIICDKRLEILFGKARVGHFEMLKLLEYHFKDGSCASSVIHAAAIDSSDNQMKVEECSEEMHSIMKEKKRQTRKKVDDRERQINLDNFAAIDVHNMSLIYLKRSLMENLMEDDGKFHDKVVGSIVRIRISGNDLKQEMYRLVRVVGTGKAAEPYKIGDKTAHIIIKILNLDKIEDVRIDTISNQDFSEDECRRLRQSIKCGLVERLTVGEVHDKAVALQEARIKDVLETEVLKLNHLRDRASEMGHRKELRECVEKLDLLKSPEERQRRMRKIPEVHADPRMDPVYQSDEDSEQSDTKQDGNTTPVHSNAISRSAEPYNTRTKLLRSSSSNWECKRNASIRPPQLSKEEDIAPVESSQSSLELETDAARILEELRNQVDPSHITNKHDPRDAIDASVTSSSRLAPSLENFKLEKIWHYRDPSGKVQGPFCILQLRKWNSSGYFPMDLRVWRIDENQDKSMLLADVLSNQCGKEHPFQSDCLESHEARSVSDCTNLGQPSININTPCTSDKFNDGCKIDLTDATKCSDDKNQQLSPEENQKSAHVVSSPGQEVSNASPASRDAEFASLNQNHKPEFSFDLPSPTPKDQNDDFKCLDVEPVHQLSAPSGSSHKSSSSPSMSLGGLDPVQPSPIIKPEVNHEKIEVQAEENKADTKVEEHSQQVTPIDLEQINLFDLPTQIPDLNNAETKTQVTESKESGTTSYLPGQDPCATWNVLSSGLEFPVPVSSANQSSEHCLTSNATCQDIGINWSWADGPIELSTLGDESVSDLLTEVEALESLHGIPSPNPHMDFGDDAIDSPSHDCFSRLVGLSRGKHDAWSTSCDVHFNSQQPHASSCDIQFNSQPPTVITEPAPVKLDFASAAQQDFLSLTSIPLPSHSLDNVSNTLNHEFVHQDHNPEPSPRPPPPPPDRNLHSSASPEVKGDVGPTSQEPPPPQPQLSSKVEASSSPTEEGEMKPTLEMPSHPKPALPSSNPNPDITRRVAAKDTTKPSMHRNNAQGNRGRYHGGGGRHSSGQKDRNYNHHIQSVDSGFVKGGRPTWHRQSSFNGGGVGGGGSRPVMAPPPPPHRGQRVCKFYESGYCRKGASCNYLHP